MVAARKCPSCRVPPDGYYHSCVHGKAQAGKDVGQEPPQDAVHQDDEEGKKEWAGYPAPFFAREKVKPQMQKGPH